MEGIVFTLSTIFFLGMFLLLSVVVLFSGAFIFKKKAPKESYSPPVTVIIPAYNEGERIGTCLEKVFASDYEGDVEVIVVDDGSTDNTREVAKGFPIKLIEQDHEGKVGALNRGIEKAGNELLFTIDADTYLEKNTIEEIARPFSDPKVGASSGIANVQNRRSILGAFQAVEYPYISYLRELFSVLFHVAPGICGALTCYRKSVLQKIGGFRKDTVLEDFDIAFQISKAGYDVVTTKDARGLTVVPGTFLSLFRQRVRWLKGSMQCVLSHRDVFARRKFAMNYILVGQLFWFIYSFFALPLMLFHMIYWLPANSATLFDLGFYAFRWASLAGVAYMLYMIPEWGVNWVYIFGVLSGVVSTAFFIFSIRRYSKLEWRHVLAIFFFFPYTLIMSLFMMGGVFSFFLTKGKGTFIS